MVHELRGLLEEVLQELDRSRLRRGHKPLNVVPATDDLVNVPPDLAQRGPVLLQDERAVPPCEDAAHPERGAVGVECAALVEHVDRVGVRVEDDESLAEEVERHDVAFRNK